MKAIVIDRASAHLPLCLGDVPEPIISATEMLVEVKAAGVNRADLRRAASHFSSDQPHLAPIPGLEFAGEVIQIGAEVVGFCLGDRVMAMGGAAFAQRVAVDYRISIAVPPTMSWEAAAATPVSFITAHDALATAGEMKAGESVLVQAASSNAGIATIQIAKLKGGRPVFGTAGAPEKIMRLRAFGCDVVIDYHGNQISDAIREATGARGVDVVIDYAGGTSLQASIDAVAVRGRVVCAGRVAGVVATFNIDEFSRKQIRMTGVTNRTRTLDERIRVVDAFSKDLWAHLSQGRLTPVVDSLFSFRDVEDAYERVRRNMHFGKVVLVGAIA